MDLRRPETRGHTWKRGGLDGQRLLGLQSQGVSKAARDPWRRTRLPWELPLWAFLQPI